MTYTKLHCKMYKMQRMVITTPIQATRCGNCNSEGLVIVVLTCFHCSSGTLVEMRYLLGWMCLSKRPLNIGYSMVISLSCVHHRREITIEYPMSEVSLRANQPRHPLSPLKPDAHQSSVLDLCSEVTSVALQGQLGVVQALKIHNTLC